MNAYIAIRKVSLLLVGFSIYSCGFQSSREYEKVNSRPTDTILLSTGIVNHNRSLEMGFRPYLKYSKTCSKGIETDILNCETGLVSVFKNDYFVDSYVLKKFDSIVTDLRNLKFTTQLDSFIIVCEGKKELMHFWTRNGVYYKTYDLVIPNSKELPAFGFFVEGLPIVADSLVFFRLFKSEVYVDNLQKWNEVTEDAPLYKLNLNTGVMSPFGEYPNSIQNGAFYGYPFINSRSGKGLELLVSHPKNHLVEVYNLSDNNKESEIFSVDQQKVFKEYDFEKLNSTKYNYEYQVKTSQYTHAGYDALSDKYYRFYLDCSENENKCQLILIFSNSIFSEFTVDTLEYGKYIDNIRFFNGGYYLEQFVSTDSILNYAYEKFLWN